MTDNLNLWIIPLLPLAGAAINGLFGRRFPKAVVKIVALAFTAASFAYAVWAALQGSHMQLPHNEALPFDWIVAGNFHVPFGFYLDQLSTVMMLIVTGVGFLIHVYAIGYMEHEGGYYRFFAYLNLFMFFMLMLVLANNYLLMFVGWEGVGLASYLLIGFFFLKDSAANAGKKAFIVNRIGDFAFLLGMFLIIQKFSSLNFVDVFEKVSKLSPETGAWGLLTAIALLLMFGATGKSAQVPLYVWLPDAMEGPTPVSALIHAATMVTAGIYMIARSHIIFDKSPHALEVVAVIGAVTALFAATMGLAQTDIKRVLAYSTVSQLGYMFLACGVAAYSAAIFHLMTHAFFKALLFLGAGSVIHAIGGEQDMRRMGGLRKLIPVTFWVVTIATFTIAGFPPLSGFFSKDEILWQAFSSPHGGSWILWSVGFITAGLTSFYMFRMWFMTFFGELKLGKVDAGEEAHAANAPAQAQHGAASASHGHGDDHSHGHGGVHESPWIMLAPLVILAILSVVGGWVGIPESMRGSSEIGHYLAPAVEPASEAPVSAQASQPANPEGSEHSKELLFAGLSVGVATLGFFLAWLLYYKRPELPDRITARIHGLYNLVYHKYYVDEGYRALFVKPLLAISTHVLWRGVDQKIIDGAVNGAGSASKGIGGELRRMQSGNIRSYAAWVAIGGAAVVVYMIWRGVGR
ncbi:MAG TPA: NADH-quinone oxidoreductase subunit L [Candidatus Angelobacter sp.]|jgi:NADH-quinone oxidoreductase subunit L|nr:NADH-quinone oxidoreductase subunit L [Candidatus Angelobacter sp.]